LKMYGLTKFLFCRLWMLFHMDLALLHEVMVYIWILTYNISLLLFTQQVDKFCLQLGSPNAYCGYRSESRIWLTGTLRVMLLPIVRMVRVRCFTVTWRCMDWSAFFMHVFFVNLDGVLQSPGSWSSKEGQNDSERNFYLNVTVVKFLLLTIKTPGRVALMVCFQC
jgi:hypothetical protein